MSELSRNLLVVAISRNLAAALSLPSAGMFRHHKSRFLGESAEGLWLQSAEDERPLLDQLIADGGTPCVVSFKIGDQRVSFATRPLKMEQQYAINDRTTVPAVLLERPDEVKAVQRRNHYRVRVREEDGLQVHVWRLGEQAQLCDRPVRGAELEARLHDLSVGGVGLVLLPKDGQSPKVLAGERVAMLLRTDAGENLLIEGRMRLAPPSEVRPDEAPSPVRAGVHFQKLDEAVEGRRTLQALTKIVGALQTQELRRQRLALI